MASFCHFGVYGLCWFKKGSNQGMNKAILGIGLRTRKQHNDNILSIFASSDTVHSVQSTIDREFAPRLLPDNIETKITQNIDLISQRAILVSHLPRPVIGRVL